MRSMRMEHSPKSRTNRVGRILPALRLSDCRDELHDEHADLSDKDLLNTRGFALDCRSED